jgi:hypothetical protein
MACPATPVPAREHTCSPIGELKLGFYWGKLSEEWRGEEVLDLSLCRSILTPRGGPEDVAVACAGGTVVDDGPSTSRKRIHYTATFVVCFVL